MKIEFLPTTEIKINEILERLERIEEMLQRLTGNDYSGKFVPKPPDIKDLLDPESTADDWRVK